MLSFNEIDLIITENLDSLNPNSYQVSREHRGQSILYTVTKLGKLLGRYRVIKKTDGNIYYGPIQGDGPEWDLLWESMLHRSIIRADGKITETLEQAYQERFNLYMKQMQEIASNESRPTINTMMEQTKKLSTVMPAKLERSQEVAKNSDDNAIKRFGTDRDMSLSDVKDIVKRCNAFVKNRGKVTEFHQQYSQDKYRLETLRKWLKDHRFID